MLDQIWKRSDFSCNILFHDVVFIWPCCTRTCALGPLLFRQGRPTLTCCVENVECVCPPHSTLMLQDVALKCCEGLARPFETHEPSNGSKLALFWESNMQTMCWNFQIKLSWGLQVFNAKPAPSDLFGFGARKRQDIGGFSFFPTPVSSRLLYLNRLHGEQYMLTDVRAHCYCASLQRTQIGHFRVHGCLLFKASLRAKFFLWKLVFIHM